MDVNELKIKINTQDALTASQNLDKLDKTVNKIDKSVDNLAKTTTKTKESLLSFNNILVGGAVAIATDRLIKYADVYTNLSSRINLTTNDIKQQTKATEELYKISQTTRQGFGQTADLYSRIAISTSDMNLKQSDMLQLTETINKAMIISGGTAESMNAAIIQLGQAFSADFKAVGQELGSLREQTPALYKAIVQGSGMSASAFRKAAEEGKLSSEIILEAIKKMSGSIDKDFAKMGITVGQSKTVFENAFIKIVGEFDKAIGASATLTNAIIGLAQSFEKIDIDKTIEEFSKYKDIVLALGLAYVSYIGYLKAVAIATTAYTTAQKLLTASTVTYDIATKEAIITTSRLTATQAMATVGTKALSSALKTIPFVAVGAGALAIADYFLTASRNADKFRDSIGKTTQELAKLTQNQLQANLIGIEAMKLEKSREINLLLIEKKQMRKEKNTPEYTQLLSDIDTARAESKELKGTLENIKDTMKDLSKLKIQNQKTDYEFEADEKKRKEEAKAKDKKALQDEANAKLNKTKDKEAKEAEKLENEKLNQLENYYRTVEDYENGWSIKKQQLAKDNNKLTEKQLSELLEVEKKNYFKPLEELKQKSIDDEIDYQDTINDKIMERSKLLVDENKEKLELLHKIANEEFDLEKKRIDAMPENTIEEVRAKEIAKVQLLNKELKKEIGYKKALGLIKEDVADKALGEQDEISNKTIEALNKKFGADEIRELEFKIKLTGFDDVSNGIAGIVNGFTEAQNSLLDLSATEQQYGKDSIQYKEASIKTSQGIVGATVDMTGAFANFYDEDDKRRKKQMELQKAMQVIQMTQNIAFLAMEFAKAKAAAATAVAVASQVPFVGIAMGAAMLSFLASVGIMLSGSGGGASDPTAQVKRDEKDYKAGQDLVVGRLDRQIELLENIDKNGSAQKAEITVSKTSFDRTLKELSYSTAKFVGVADKARQDFKASVARPIEIAASVGIDIGDIRKYQNGAYGRVWIDTRSLAGDVENSLKFIAALYESIDNTGMIEKATVYGWVDVAQEALSNYANSMVDIVGEMQNASDDLQDAYDKITGTTTYETLRLQEAYSDFDEIRGSLSYAEYIKNQIEAIKQVEDSFGDDIVSLLLSSDFNDFSKQVEALNELSKVTGIAFSGGVEDALNYIDSIELVADAQSELVDKMKDFIDGMNDMGDSIQDTINKLLGIENDSQSAMISDFWDKKSQADTILAKGSNMSEEDIDTLGNLIKDINTLSTSIQGENKGTTSNLVEELLKLKLGVSTANLPSFDIGSSYIPNDMTANIHQGEMIIPKNFADSVRAGQISIGGNSYNTDNSLLRQELRYLNDKMGKMIALNDRQLSTQRQQLSMMEA